MSTTLFEEPELMATVSKGRPGRRPLRPEERGIVISISLPPDILDAIDAMAKNRRKPRSAFLRDLAIEEALRKQINV